MKIIIIGNRKYRYIITKLMELEERLKEIQPEKEGVVAGTIVQQTSNPGITEEVYIAGNKVCMLLCISGRTLLRLCRKHQINSIRVSHQCYYPLSEIEKLFANRSIAFAAEIRERLKRECKRLKGISIERDVTNC